MKRTIGAILFVIYSIIAITVTVLLLSFNDYQCSEIGGYTVYIVKDDSLEPEYKEGSILLIKSTSDKHVKVGDSLFFYSVINSQEYNFVNRTLVSKTQQGRHITYEVSAEEIQGNETYNTTYFVGRAEDTIVIEGPWGTILSILESKWGFLFCIVIVSLLLFLQEVFDLIIELKYGGTKGTKAAHTANARKNAKNTTTQKATTTVAKKKTTATKVATAAKVVEKAVEVNDIQSETKEEG